MTLRMRGLLVAAAVAAALVMTSPPRIVGDGAEYISQAITFSHLRGPGITRRDIRDIEARIRAVDARFDTWSVETATVIGRDRSRDFQHFWFYGLTAAPFLWVTDLASAHPARAFALVNCVLLLGAMWVALPRVGPTATVLLFLSPVIWWIDKAHTEVFTVSLLTIAMALMRERPGLAVAAAGIAATQNPPIAALAIIIFIITWFERGLGAWRRPEILAGTVVGFGAAILQPAYTLLMHGTPSLLLAATIPGMPSLGEIAAVPFDLNVGLVVGFPAWLIAVAIAGALLLLRDRPAILSPGILGATCTGAVFLVAFATTANIRHGATPGMSRYALWLVPLAIPAIARLHARGDRAWRRSLAPLTCLSAALSLWIFHPARPRYWTQPTRISMWLWTQHPSWSNPIPEVFAEVLRQEDRTGVPTATPNCEKVLVGHYTFDSGLWPMPCPPVPLSTACTATGAHCYANRSGNAYGFSRTPGRQRPITPAGREWPRQSEVHVRAWFDERGWWPLLAQVNSLDAMRAAIGVRATTLGSTSHFVVILEQPAADATLGFRLPAPMRGEFLDPLTGQTAGTIQFLGTPDEMFVTPVPADHTILLLEMTGAPN